MENLSGRQLGGFQIVGPLGEGGMASVYKAYQPSMDRYVALKILPRHFANNPEFVSRFEQEARLIARLEHAHIVPVHDFGEADGYTFLVMRFIDGGTLDKLLTKKDALPLSQIQRIIAQIGDALDYAHSQGVIHRDIKPSNIMIDNRGNSLLTDFGIAKIVEGTANITQTGGIIGTPAYMSPEQISGEKLDSRTDIYSFGIVLYQMAVGQVPFRAETPPAVLVKHLHDPLPLPSSLNPSLPEGIERVILKSLAKNREHRFSTAGDLVRTLQMEISKAALKEDPRFDVTQQKYDKTNDSVRQKIEEPDTVDEHQPPPPKRSFWRKPYVVLGTIIFAAFASLILCALVLVIGGTITSSGTDSTPQTASTNDATRIGDKHAEEGINAALASDYELAAQKYELAIEAGVSEYELDFIYGALGTAYDNLDQFDKATDAYNKAIEINPNYYEAWNGLGSIQLTIGELDKAEKNINKALSLNPDYPLALGNLGLLYVRTNKPEQAIKVLEKAIKLDSREAIFSANIALAYAMAGRFEEADAALKQAAILGYANASILQERVDNLKALEQNK